MAKQRYNGHGIALSRVSDALGYNSNIPSEQQPTDVHELEINIIQQGFQQQKCELFMKP